MQAHVDAPALANSTAHLNTSTTFSPLQPPHDTDVNGYLRHAHEQNLISTIEEGRRETQEDFHRVLEERNRKDWDARKKRIFEELGGRTSAVDGAGGQSLGRSLRASTSLGVRYFLLSYLEASAHEIIPHHSAILFSAFVEQSAVAEQNDGV